MGADLSKSPSSPHHTVWPTVNGLHGPVATGAARWGCRWFESTPAPLKQIHRSERSEIIATRSQNRLTIALALALLDIYVFPARPRDEVVRGVVRKAKTPYTNRGHLEATTNESQIRAWWMQHPDALIGVNAGMSGLVTLDVDMGEDAKGGLHDGWASLIEFGLDDVPETITYKTPRGGDHFVYEPIDQRRLNGTSPHILPDGRPVVDVDRRAGSSYFLWYGDYVPVARDEFAPAPEWLMTEAPEPKFNPYEGGVTSWMEKCDQGDPSPLIKEWVRAIPDDDFNHSDMIVLQAALVDLGAKGEPGVPYALGVLREEWLRGPYNTPDYAEDFDVSLRGAISKFGAFAESAAPNVVDPVPVQEETPGQPSATTDSITIQSDPLDFEKVDVVTAYEKVANAAFYDAWTTLPKVVTPESLAERVRHVMGMAVDSGLSRTEVLALGWASAARRAEGCPLDLPDEVAALIPEPNDEIEPERLYAVEPEAKATVEPLAVDRKIHLLTPREEAVVKDLRWWGDEFMQRMSEVNSVMSEQYYRLSRWTLLSLIFAPHAIIPDENGTKVPLNFYTIRRGPSGSGKSESLNPIMDMNAAYYVPEEDPDIGGDSSTAGLTQALIRRDGQASFFHADEADAVLRQWSESTGAFSGMKNRIMEIFTGKVPMLNRTTAKEISGIRAKAYLCVDLIGVDDRITDTIQPHDWESGFINRFIWAKGERKPRTREQKKFRIRRNGTGAGKGVEDWYEQWAAEFRATAGRTLGTPDGQPAWIDMTEEVRERDVDLKEKFDAIAQNSRYPERLRPTFTRMEMTVMKCAALVAITKRRRRIEIEDYLIALEQAEEWTENLIEVVAATDRSPRSRQVDRLADLVRSKGGTVNVTEIHADEQYAGDWRFVDGLITELKYQGRIEELPVMGGQKIIRLKEAA